MLCFAPHINDDQNENKSDKISSLSYYSSVPLEKQTNTPQSLSKTQLSKIINRNRRASISRPYFQHWRQTRDHSRYLAKNAFAFSPRLGKRVYENKLDNVDNKFTDRLIDLNIFFLSFAGHLQEKQIDIVYEDSTKICLSQLISDGFIQQVLDKADISRRNKDEQDKEETSKRQTIGKHPVLFRYRLG
jgi:hypothetical protein